MSFVSDLLPDIDGIRGIPGDMGLRPYTVTVRKRLWSGGQVALGTPTDADTRLYVGGLDTRFDPKCRRVAYKETVAGGGRYQEGDFKVGPFSPDFPGAGVPFGVMAPATVAGTEVYYVLVGPDSPVTGHVCTVVGQEGDHPLHRYLVVRPAGAVL